MRPGTHACLPATRVSEHYLYAQYCARHHVTKIKKIKNTGMFLNSVGENACKQTIINEEMMALLEVRTKKIWQKGAPGKMSREGGTLMESSRGQAGGECSKLREIRCKHNMTMDDERWPKHGEMRSRSPSRRGEKRKKCISYACSQFYFSEYK